MRPSTFILAVSVFAMPVALADELRFEAHLAPYGTWTNVPQYGRVWSPSRAVVGLDFEPYSTGGHWAFTDQGWVFDSRWPFAWAAFHYGRWFLDPELGWVWAPGDQWAPAWVEWRSGGGYVGWAPMGPVGIELRFPGYRSRWAFVETRDLVTPEPWRHRLDDRRAVEAYHAAAPVSAGNRQWSAGPPVAHVSVAAGVAIEPRHIATPPRGQPIAPRQRAEAPPPPPRAESRGFPMSPLQQAPPRPPAMQPQRDGFAREAPRMLPPPRAPQQVQQQPQKKNTFVPPPPPPGAKRHGGPSQPMRER